MKTSSGSRLAYKYRSGDLGTLSRDLKSLAAAEFYAADRHALNDPFEGRFERAAFDGQFAALETLVSGIAPRTSESLNDVRRAAEAVLAFVDKSGVFSLSKNPLQELIWAHYGGSHRGFCVGYDMQKLVDFDASIHNVLDVQYSNVAPGISSTELLIGDSPGGVLQKMLGVKSKPWAYEEEVRVITQPPGRHNHDYRAVKVIYFGLRCPESTKMAVMETMAGRDITYQQVISPQSSYVLKALIIPDRCVSATRYMANCAFIEDGAILPEYLKPELKQYAEYLNKAAEVVRRDPYCQAIQFVNFSGDKGSPNKPVILVQYRRAPSKWVNRYMTLAEIDKQYSALGLPNNS
ncbi:DUF2971 domain-containing protein [Alcaligenaceae bacterium B3P038]|nr:DUF2971 domain-containing protein [Alcaligenaceae bacterium B3P038]